MRKLRYALTPEKKEVVQHLSGNRYLVKEYLGIHKVNQYVIRRPIRRPTYPPSQKPREFVRPSMQRRTKKVGNKRVTSSYTQIRPYTRQRDRVEETKVKRQLLREEKDREFKKRTPVKKKKI